MGGGDGKGCCSQTYASSSGDRYIRRYAVAPDGRLGDSTLFVDPSKE